MGGGKSSKVDVTDYNMSIHYGLCHGPIDAIESIIIGEKTAWQGEVTAQSIISVTRRGLFGGPKKEGGVAGAVYYLPGGPTQVMPQELALRFGRTSATMPAYRSIASVFFVGGNNARAENIGVSEPWVAPMLASLGMFYVEGFLWGTNNPYLKGSWFKIRRSPKALATDLRMIGADANPAAMIYEALTNPEWGMGGAPGTIDTASFSAAAQTLKDESFGLSMQWTRQSTIEDFVSEVLDHIQATLFINPRNGLTTIKLIRADYSVGALSILTPDNCHVVSFDRMGWGETANEIVATWTNPENEQEETVVAQNLANITIQGCTISDSRNYYGVRSANLAMKLAKRDLAIASSPLATFEIEVDRSAWDFTPGSCVRLYYPEYGIENLVLRIMSINYGKPGEPTIKISAAEDIFSNPATAYDEPTDTEWTDPSEDPVPLTDVRIVTAPAFIVSRLDPELTRDYPEVVAAILASTNSGDTASYELLGQSVLTNGEVVTQTRGSKSLLGHANLLTGLVQQPATLIPSFGTVTGGPGPRIAGFVFIGDTVETGQEIALIQSASEAGWTLKRGVLDTTPRAWPAGTPVWFVNSDSTFIDTAQIYADGQNIMYKMLTYTSKGVLDIADAPTLGAKMTGRPHLPNRPANVKVGGVAFGALDLSAAPLPTTVSVTWSIRNRLLEDSQVLGWTEAGMPGEAGQTTTVRIYSTDGVLLAGHDGLSGESFDIPIASFGGRSRADVRVTSERDGLESLQGHTIRVKLRDGGYGDNYGESYGSTIVLPAGDPDPGPLTPDYVPDPGTPFPEYPSY